MSRLYHPGGEFRRKGLTGIDRDSVFTGIKAETFARVNGEAPVGLNFAVCDRSARRRMEINNTRRERLSVECYRSLDGRF